MLFEKRELNSNEMRPLLLLGCFRILSRLLLSIRSETYSNNNNECDEKVREREESLILDKQISTHHSYTYQVLSPPLPTTHNIDRSFEYVCVHCNEHVCAAAAMMMMNVNRACESFTFI